MSGVKREAFPDGYVIVHFTNKDIKQILPDKTEIYFYAEASTTQITIPNGQSIYLFSNNQIEIHFPDGMKEIKFSDGTEKYLFANGEEHTLFTDGTLSKIDPNQVKTVEYANGDKEIFYPDGVKMKKSKNDQIF